MSLKDAAQDKSRKISDYLLLVTVSVISQEQQVMLSRLSDACTESAVFLWVHEKQVAFGCRSRLLAWELRHFATADIPAVSNSLVIELARDWSISEKETKAAGWLNSHLGAPLNQPR